MYPNLHAKRPVSSRALSLAGAVAATSVALGALLGFAGPLLAVALVVALGIAVWALSDVEIGLWGALAVIALLPWGALPVKIVVTPTFLDLALGGVLLTYLLQWMTGARRRFTSTPVHGLLLAFLLLAVFSFVAGMGNGPLTSNLIRHFAELLLSIGMALVVVDTVDTTEKLARLARVILICGAAAAAIGIALYFIPQTLSERLLSALRVFNYPSGGVLRYLEDNPELAQRAIGTSVDPNVLGGFLAIVGGLLAPQLLVRRLLFSRRWLAWLAFAVVVAGLVLTYSRGAMAALAVGLAGIGMAKYRKALIVLALVGALLFLLPWTQNYAAHFLEGAQGQDLATQMRFGEYGDALKLIARYPFGVGFAASPDIDLYLGVSSAYLLIAEAMGFPGLAVFLAVVGGVYLWAFMRRKQALADERLGPLWLGAHAGLAASLVVGVFDHYFFNIEFQPASAIFWIFVGLCLASTRLASRAQMKFDSGI